MIIIKTRTNQDVNISYLCFKNVIFVPLGNIHLIRKTVDDILCMINIKGSKYFPLNVTFLNKKSATVAFQILLTLLHEKSVDEKPRFNNWIIVHKLEYISYFSPFSIFWRHSIVKIHANILSFKNIQPTNKTLSVLHINYQLTDLQLETVPDYKTVMAVQNKEKVSPKFTFYRNLLSKLLTN